MPFAVGESLEQSLIASVFSVDRSINYLEIMI